MKSTISKTWLLVMVLLGAITMDSYAQAPACPPDDPNCPWQTRTFQHHGISTNGTVAFSGTVRWRICNGITEFVYDNIVAEGNGAHMANFSIYHYNFSSFMESLDIHLIEHLGGDIPSTQQIPNCPNTTRLVKFYSASCGVWVKCSYKVDPASERCDDGYTPPSPMYSDGADRWVDVYKWQPCGTTCCRKTYTVCRGTSPEGGSNRIMIQQVERVKIIPCTLEGTFKDWRTGNVIPCQDGC